MTTEVKLTAEEYKASLLPDGRKRVTWTFETAAKYVNLLYPHVTLVSGQDWAGVNSTYKFFCDIHGEYQTSLRLVFENRQGCGCTSCVRDNQVNSAGTKRCSRITNDEKELAIKLYSEGLSYRAIGRQLGRSNNAIVKILNPESREKQRLQSNKWHANNSERRKENYRRWSSDFAHGKANSLARNSCRRRQKQNTPELVFLDNKWHEVDRDLTWDVFNEFLLPHSERKEIQELYLECDYLIQQTGVEHHVDHIWPLSVGGEHRMINLQILPAFDNLSKHNTFRKEDQEEFCRRWFN